MEQERKSMVALVIINVVDGGKFPWMYDLSELKETLSLQQPSANNLPSIEIGQILTKDGKKYKVESVKVEMGEISEDGRPAFLSGMYQESYNGDCNIRIIVSVKDC